VEAATCSVPVLFPAYAVVHGNTLTMEISCTAKCHGSGTLRRAAATSAAKHKKASGARARAIATFRFSLAGKGVKKVAATLTAKGRKLLAGKKRLIVTATRKVIIGKARPQTYASAVAVTRTSPKTLHVKGLHAAIRLP
jgi:hypothetical protein